MAEQLPKTRELPWSEWFPWLILVRSVRVALMARVIILATIGLIAMTLGWRAIGWVFPVSGDTVIQEWHKDAGQWLWDQSREFAITLSAQSAKDLFVSATDSLPEAPISIWLHFTRPFRDMFSKELTAAGFLHLLLCAIWELLVWAVAGGAITRIAALKLTRNEAPGFVAALKYALGKIISYSAAPLIALAGASVFWVQLMVVGLLMQVDVLAMVAGLAWPFVLLLGLLMSILLLGALVGWPLMWATVSVEGTDAFDALSRSYAYTYQRPWRMLWYVLFAAFLAAVSMFVVKLFAASAIALGDWSVDWGLDLKTMNEAVLPASAPADVDAVAPPPVEMAPPVEVVPPVEVALPADEPAADPILRDSAAGVTESTGDLNAADEAQPPFTLRTARWAIDRWKMLVKALAAGYQAGFLWVSAVAVYLLLRRDIDGVEMNEAFPDRDDDFGLPPLHEDAATGVPAVAPGDPAQRGDTGSAL
jgi:hypothetical protein